MSLIPLSMPRCCALISACQPRTSSCSPNKHEPEGAHVPIYLPLRYEHQVGHVIPIEPLVILRTPAHLGIGLLAEVIKQKIPLFWEHPPQLQRKCCIYQDITPHNDVECDAEASMEQLLQRTTTLRICLMSCLQGTQHHGVYWLTLSIRLRPLHLVRNWQTHDEQLFDGIPIAILLFRRRKGVVSPHNARERCVLLSICTRRD